MCVFYVLMLLKSVVLTSWIIPINECYFVHVCLFILLGKGRDVVIKTAGSEVGQSFSHQLADGRCTFLTMVCFDLLVSADLIQWPLSLSTTSSGSIIRGKPLVVSGCQLQPETSGTDIKLNST